MIECNGSIVHGDTIEWIEDVYGEDRGIGYNPVLGQRTNVGSVIKESYGKEKQQHTFTILIESSDGFRPLPEGKEVLRKGRVLHRYNPKRKLWDNEETRRRVEDQKQIRGARARHIRDVRKRTGQLATEHPSLFG